MRFLAIVRGAEMIGVGRTQAAPEWLKAADYSYPPPQ